MILHNALKPDEPAYTCGVLAVICGRRITNITLDAFDIAALRELTDAQLREWLDHMATRFAPVTWPR